MKRPTLNLSRALVAAALAQTAQAQFTYTGGTLNSAQTYDGLGVDSALNPNTIGSSSANNYIGDGSGGNGSLSVVSGSLTINSSDFKVANWNGSGTQPIGSITVSGAGTVLNLNNIGQWGGGVGQRGNGSLTVGSGSTVNWLINGSNEQRMMIGNGGSGVGTLNLNGGSLNLSLGTVSLTDSERQFRVGSDGATGVLNLNAGALLDSMALPFFLGGKYSNLNTTPSTTIAAGSSGAINILNGAFIMNAAYAPIDPNKATFTVGSLSGSTTGVINFQSGGTGSLSLYGWQQSDYAALAGAGDLQVNGNTVSDLSDFSYQFSGGQGILTLVPEPSSLALLGCGLLGLAGLSRRRR